MSTENQTNVLSDLVGEGKKFASVEDLAKGKVEADVFIASLTEELRLEREEKARLATESKRNELLEKLMSDLQKNNDINPDTTKLGNQPSTANNNQNGSGLSHDDVVKLLEAREVAAQANRNLASAYEPLRKAYGEKTTEVLERRAGELGMKVADLESLARTSPQAFISLVGVPGRDSSTRSMANHSSVNSAAQGDKTGGVRNKAYYESLKKEMGSQKFILDSKIQVQMHNDYMALGDSWDS